MSCRGLRGFSSIKTILSLTNDPDITCFDCSKAQCDFFIFCLAQCYFFKKSYLTKSWLGTWSCAHRHYFRAFCFPIEMLGMNLELMSAIHSPPILSPHSVQASRFRKVFHLSNHVISWFYHLILFKDDMGDGYVCLCALVNLKA